MWTEWLFQAEQGGSRLPDYMAPPVWNIHRESNYILIYSYKDSYPMN